MSMPARPDGLPPQAHQWSSTPQQGQGQPLQFQQYAQPPSNSGQQFYNPAAGFPAGQPGQPPPAPTGAQAGQSNVGRPAAGALPPIPQINTSDFPFPWQLLTYVSQVSNPAWRAEMQARNPQMLAAVQSAAQKVHSGMVRPDILQRMQAMVFHSARMSGQGSRSGAPVGQGQGPQPGQGGPTTAMPGPPNQGLGAPQNVLGQGPSPAQRMMQPPAASPGMAPIRPPPHLMAGAAGSPSSAIATPTYRPGSSKGMPPPPFPMQSTPSGPPQPPVEPPQPAVPVKEWTEHLRMDMPITKIQALPLTHDEAEDPTFGGQLRALSDQEIGDVRQWLEADKEFVHSMHGNKDKIRARMSTWMRETQRSTPWWLVAKGERYHAPSSSRLTVIWPQDKVGQRAKTSHRGRREIRFSPAQMRKAAEADERVVPVRLELDHDHWKLRDTFMWNVADGVVTPELFAQCLCEDFQVPPGPFVPKIVSAIHERVREYESQVRPMAWGKGEKGPGQGKLEEGGEGEGAEMWQVFRRARAAAEREQEKEGGGDPEDEGEIPGEQEQDEGDGSATSATSQDVRTDAGDDAADKDVRILLSDGYDEYLVLGPEGDEAERPMTVEEMMKDVPDSGVGEELRVLIKVDIIIGTQNLTDTFEWDLNSGVSPEEFAASYVRELGLSGEFA